MRQRQHLERSINTYRQLERELDDSVTLIELGETEGDAASVTEGGALLKKLDEEAQRRSVEALLSGEADANDTYVEVHAGAGGTESQDWASMLARMYMRWAEQRGYKVAVIEESPGEEAGIKSVTIEVKGDSKREANEYFYLDLFGNSGNSLFTKNRGLGTILNDD